MLWKGTSISIESISPSFLFSNSVLIGFAAMFWNATPSNMLRILGDVSSLSLSAYSTASLVRSWVRNKGLSQKGIVNLFVDQSYCLDLVVYASHLHTVCRTLHERLVHGSEQEACTKGNGSTQADADAGVHDC
jgi:hypothetical protein